VGVVTTVWILLKVAGILAIVAAFFGYAIWRDRP
jgi:hypothetical protein